MPVGGRARVCRVERVHVVEQGARERRAARRMPALADDAVSSGQLDLIMVGKAHLANPHWAYHTARELKIDHASWTLPAPYAHWLERY